MPNRGRSSTPRPPRRSSPHPAGPVANSAAGPRAGVDALQVVGVAKNYGSTRALSDVTFSVRRGEVHALMGENGAGKSTLMRIASGIVRPDAGSLIVDDAQLPFGRPSAMRERGLQVVFQELTVLDNLDLAHNLFVTGLPHRFGVVRSRELYRMAAETFDRLGLDLDPRALAGTLSVGMKQVLEIARAVAQNPSVLLLDEPTSSLGREEEELVFRLVRELRGQGVAIVYVTHRMAEVFALADRITVLRDGHTVMTRSASAVARQELIAAMVGRVLVPTERVAHVSGHEVLTVQGLGGGIVRDVSLSLQRGEVLGLAGLMGSGRSEVARMIAGIDTPETGTMRLRGEPFRPKDVKSSLAAGVCYVSEDRKLTGLHLAMSIAENISLPVLRSMQRRGFLNLRGIRDRAQEWIGRLNIRTQGPSRAVDTLSGGNQQKVALAKWLATNPDVILLDEPTRGVDVGAKAEIHELIRSTARAGAAVLVISSELPEVIGVSDRIAVMAGGRIAGIVNGTGATEESILELAFRDTSGEV